MLEETNQRQATVTVRPAVDFSSLEYVLVLQSPGHPRGADGLMRRVLGDRR